MLLCNMAGRVGEGGLSGELLCAHFRGCYLFFRAAAVLAQVEPSLAELLGGRDLALPFSGIRHFRKEVVFVGLDAGEHRHTLDSLAGQSLSSLLHSSQTSLKVVKYELCLYYYCIFVSGTKLDRFSLFCFL